MKKNYIVNILFFSSIFSVSAQEIALYSGLSIPTATSVANTTATALTRGTGVDLNAGASFNSKNWSTEASISDAITYNDYIEWSIAASSTYIVTITGIEIDYDRSNSGPKQVAIRTSLDNYTTDVFSDVEVNASGEENTISSLSLTSIEGGSITFRLYGFDASSTGTFDIEDDLSPTLLSLTGTGIILNGTVQIESALVIDSVKETKIVVSSINGVFSANKGEIVAVYNALGQRVLNEGLTGVYFVKVTLGTQIKTIQVVVN